MTLKVNHENMRATYHFGLKTLFDGYLTALELLCDGYVIDDVVLHHNMLNFNEFLCDGYVIGRSILCDGYLIKVKK